MSAPKIADTSSAPAPAPVQPTSATPAAVSTETQATETTPKPTSPETIKGLTPNQIVEELKKSGYFDSLRRQLFEAFTAPPAPVQSAAQPAPAVAPSASPSQPETRYQNNAQTQSSLPSTSATIHAVPINATDAAATAKPAATEAPQPSNAETSSTPAMNIGSKSAFTSFLATPLRHQVEKEHDRLRFLDPRGQQDNLLKLLESDPVDYPQRETLGEGTIYDLLIHSLLTSRGTGNGSGTNSILTAEGKLGKQMRQKIGEVVAEMSKAKDDAEDEEEDDEEDGEDEETENVGEAKAHPSQSTEPPISKMEQD
ncbi:hypothetical protein NDA14_007880 [Ustilago hordei]|nr:hypothetical protein NDA14_007880 [Ustilago hordei]UTT96962.1 hypothetical protein NDA17_001237 [Ustilago hordei]